MSAVIPATHADQPTQMLGAEVFSATKSPSDLRAHALRMVTQGHADVGANGIKPLAPNGINTVVAGNTPNAIMASLSAYKFTFSLLDPSKDQVWINAGLTMPMTNSQYQYTYQYQLFSGGGWGQVVKDSSGKLAVPTPDIPMYLNYKVPIPVSSDVQWVSLYYRDSNGGYVQWQDNVTVQDGYMLFPSEYAGKAGQLVLFKKDGTSQVVDIQTGAEVLSQLVTTSGKMGLTNYQETDDASLPLPTATQPNWLYVPFVVAGSRSSSDAPVVRVKLKAVRVIDIIGATASYAGKVEKPVITATGPHGQIVKGTPVTDGTVSILPDEAGDWDVTFDYPTLFGEDVPPQSPWDNSGGGKG